MSKYLECIQNLKQMINDYPLEITSGTKKMIKDYNIKAKQSRNDLVKQIKEDYAKDAEILKQGLKKMKDIYYNESSNDEINFCENQFKLLKKVTKYNNPFNDIYDKSNFARTIYDIDNTSDTDLKQINDILLYIINKFKKANVRLEVNDFNYTMYTYKYMNVFLNNMESDLFDDKMTEIFDEIYWNCPNLLTELKLNVLYLVIKYDKQIEEFCKNRRQNLFEQANCNIDNYMDIYNECRLKLENLKNIDPNLNTKKFIDGELNINDYLENSPIRNSKFKRFIDTDFEDLSDEEKAKFFEDIIELKNIIYEVENYHIYEKIVKDVKERYNDKDKFKGLLNSKLKESKKEEKVRQKLLKKYNKLISKKKINENKINVIIKNMADQIKKLEQIYLDIEDARINTRLVEYINEGSTVYDALFFARSFYSYIKQIFVSEYDVTDIKQINDLVEKMGDFIYNPNIILLKKVNLFSEVDLEYIVINKCQLFNINLSKEDLLNNLDSLKKDMDFISTIYYIENSNTSFDNIKFICEVNKI